MTGIKHDKGKPRWDLLPLRIVGLIVDVITFGAKTYGDNNWKELADPERRYFAACMRHLSAWQSGEKYADDSGLPHLAHAACNLIFLMHFDSEDRKTEEPKEPRTWDFHSFVAQFHDNGPLV